MLPSFAAEAELGDFEAQADVGSVEPAGSAEFDKAAKAWLARAKHPRWKRPYTELAYQPMLEVMRYLRANGATVFYHNVGFAMLAFASYGSASWVPTFFISARSVTPASSRLLSPAM